jgi:hypothetical protein
MEFFLQKLLGTVLQPFFMNRVVIAQNFAQVIKTYSSGQQVLPCSGIL